MQFVKLLFDLHLPPKTKGKNAFVLLCCRFYLPVLNKLSVCVWFDYIIRVYGKF